MRDADAETVRLGVEFEGRERELFYRFRGAPVRPDADAWAALALPLAMRLGAPLRLRDPISGTAASALRQLSEIHACWYPDVLAPVPLEFEQRTADPALAPATGVATFFSGGIDSFYCLRKHQTGLTHLIFVHGFDIPLANTPARESAVGTVRRVAAELGLALIDVETNIREVMDPYLLWGRQYLTLAMAPIPLLLGSTLRRCYVPSEYSYARTEPTGSHPLTTLLLSSPSVNLEHAGAEANRNERVRALADDPLARQYARVCWQNVPGQYNCCRCQKCLAAMCTLRAIDKLSSFSAFPQEVDLEVVSRLGCWLTNATWTEILACVRQRGTDVALERALLTLRRRSLQAARRQGLVDRLPGGLRRWGGSLRRRLRRG